MTGVLVNVNLGHDSVEKSMYADDLLASAWQLVVSQIW